MKRVFYMLVISCMIFACQDIPEGYLFIEDAGYLPDTMLVKKVLEADPVLGPNPDWEYYMSEYEDWGYEYYTEEEWIEMLHNDFGVYEEIEIEGPDYDRARLEIPWVSTAIQGVEGTKPVNISITRISTDVGDVDKMMACLTVRNNGMFTLPCYNDVPAGRYKISIHVAGPGHAADLKDVFTIVVK